MNGIIITEKKEKNETEFAVVSAVKIWVHLNENWSSYEMTLSLSLSLSGDLSQGWCKGSLFNSCYTEVYGRALLLSLLHFILDIYFILLSIKQGGTK